MNPPRFCVIDQANPCEQCGGTGRKDSILLVLGRATSNCPECQGTGRRVVSLRDALEFLAREDEVGKKAAANEYRHRNGD